MNKFLEQLTKISFLALATIPLLRPDHNSKVIIFCALLTIYSFFKLKPKVKFELKHLVFIAPFVLFLLYEFISGSSNKKTILLQLPFLIFPLLFIFRPKFIDQKIKEKSLYVFQFSVALQSFIYFFVFIKSNSIVQLFDISKENIPFFREFVTNNYYFEIHPTYFSSFLLISLTISFFKFRFSRVFNALNIALSVFFIILFSSRIMILLLILTLISLVLYFTLKDRKRNKYAFLMGLILIPILIIIFKSNVVKQRFNETITEINKPIVGNYYNATNTRVAIYKCDFLLLKDFHFFGYGDKLQAELDNCYAENNDSNFYKISVFNTHNYYFHLILYGGIIFLLLFAAYLVVLFKNLKYSVLGIFIFSQFLIINITENYLSRHYGIVLFCYFTAMFIFIRENENTTTKHI